MYRFQSQDPYFNGGYKAMNIILEEDPQQGRGALWLGDYTAAQDRSTLKAKGIKCVLTVAQGLNISYPQGSDINHKTYNIQDIESATISKIWNDTYQRIDEGLTKGGVLVHCAAGVSRSASTVIAYIMRKKGQGFNETLNFVRSRRPVICPNFGFQRQLKSFERELKQQEQQGQLTPFNSSKEKAKPNYINQLQQALVSETPNKLQAYHQIQFTPAKTSNPQIQRQMQSTVKQKLYTQSPLIKQAMSKTRQADSIKSKTFIQGLGNLQEKQLLVKQDYLQPNANKSPFQVVSVPQQHQSPLRHQKNPFQRIPK